MNNIKHVYEFDNCAGCQKEIGDTELFTEIVKESVDGKTKEHIALCEKCERTARQYGVI